MSTRTRFEKEARDNSEMAYYTYALFFNNHDDYSNQAQLQCLLVVKSVFEHNVYRYYVNTWFRILASFREHLIFIPLLTLFRAVLERFSNDCRKTKTKAITPANHNRSKQRDERITIPSNYL